MIAVISEKTLAVGMGRVYHISKCRMVPHRIGPGMSGDPGVCCGRLTERLSRAGGIRVVGATEKPSW